MTYLSWDASRTCVLGVAAFSDMGRDTPRDGFGMALLGMENTE